MTTKPRRTGRRPGSQETEAEVLAAARQLFAERGFAGTSFRAIGERAQVDPALVAYYFETKEGLFRAALDVPVDPDELVSEILSAGEEDIPLRLVQTLIGLWDGPETGLAITSYLRRILSEANTSSLIGEFAGATILQTAAARLLSTVDPAEARIRIELVISQMLGLAIARKLLKLEPIASMPAGELAVAVAPTIARYLHGDLGISRNSHAEQPQPSPMMQEGRDE